MREFGVVSILVFLQVIFAVGEVQERRVLYQVPRGMCVCGFEHDWPHVLEGGKPVTVPAVVEEDNTEAPVVSTTPTPKTELPKQEETGNQGCFDKIREKLCNMSRTLKNKFTKCMS